MASTSIEWTNCVWNPVTGCSHVSEGCRNCYAERMDRRQMMPGRKDGFRPWTAQNAEYNVRLRPERLGQPLKWKKPRRVFVDSMSDLFHERVPDEFIAQVLSTMFRAPLHTYLVLTKRSIRMQQLMNSAAFKEQVFRGFDSGHWPPQMLWLGVSAEDQKTFDERVPLLLRTPAALRWVSLEPLLGPVNITPFHLYAEEDIQPTGKFRTRDGARQMQFKVGSEHKALHWVVVGSESGPGRRETDIEWVRSIKDRCVGATVPFFLKQLHQDGKKVALPKLDGRTWDEFPEVS